VTNGTDTASFEQAGLPFGAALDAESTGATGRRFTSYDRSAATGLDYALNRRYDPSQGRFTQVDPLGAGAADITDPQT
jgi:RHS repeat-associated protein